jgi:4'-phosphopantetheinyl transferase
MLSNWIPVDTLPPLDSEVQLWQIQLSSAANPSEHYKSLLSPLEQAHAEQYRHDQAREHFTIGRACLRILLGNAVSTDPRSVVISTGIHGKPETPAVDGKNIFFNIGHSKDMILIALSRQGILGVDVEYFDRQTDIMEVAGCNFTEKETASLASITDPEARIRLFYRYWTRKEAVAKADGRGLLLPLSSFDVSHDSTNLHPVCVSDSTDDAGKSYFVSDLELGDGAAGALAVESSNCGVTELIFPLMSYSSLPKVGAPLVKT